MAIPPLFFVTGKGGTGKSTVAAALALALSDRSRTILADLDHPAAARLLRVEPNGGPAQNTNLQLLSLSRRAELEAFIERIVPLKAVSRRMLRSRTFAYVTAALPGLEAFLTLERLRLIADDAAAQNSFAVVDGPASGGLVELLSVPQGIRTLASSGTLNRLAVKVEEFLRNKQRLGVLLTVRPERFAILEALETAALLRDGLSLAQITVILNGVPEPLFSMAEAAQLPPGAHRDLARRRRAMTDLAAHARRQFIDAGIRVFDLPMLYTPAFTREQLEVLAETLRRSDLLDKTPQENEA